MNRTRIVSIGAILAVYAAFCVHTLLEPGMFSDDKWYLLLVDVFRGDAVISEVAIPFCWRPVVPLVVAVISVMVPLSTTTVFILVSIGFGAGFLILLYRICLHFTENDIVILPIMLLVVTGANLNRYAAAALIDMAQLFFIALLALWTLQDKPLSYIIPALFVGVFVKETVIFAVLLYIVYRQSWSGVLGGLIVGVVYLGFRLGLSGTISQGLGFRLENFTIRLDATIQNIAVGLFVVGVLWLVGMLLVSDLDGDALKWFVISTLTVGVPIAVLGFFFAFSGARFLMPLWIGVVPMITSMFDKIGKGIGEHDRDL